jgi:hypothetical protein
MTIGSSITDKVVQRLTAPTGVNARLAQLTQAETSSLPAIGEKQILAQNVASELAERSLDLKYPAMNVYCERISNELREKFRTFSGTVDMAIEIRLSQDRLEGLEHRLQLYADAVIQVLNASRGDWGDGMFFTGIYKIGFNSVKHGGKNFIQTAKIAFEIGLNRN